MDPALDARRVAGTWSAAIPRIPVDDLESLDGVGGGPHGKLVVANKKSLGHLARLQLRRGKIVAPQSVRTVRASTGSVADEIAGVESLASGGRFPCQSLCHLLECPSPDVGNMASPRGRLCVKPCSV